MRTVVELGAAVAEARKSAGKSRGTWQSIQESRWESLVRFERGHVADFGSRKLLAVLTVLDLEVNFTEELEWLRLSMNFDVSGLVPKSHGLRHNVAASNEFDVQEVTSSGLDARSAESQQELGKI